MTNYLYRMYVRVVMLKLLCVQYRVLARFRCPLPNVHFLVSKFGKLSGRA